MIHIKKYCIQHIYFHFNEIYIYIKLFPANEFDAAFLKISYFEEPSYYINIIHCAYTFLFTTSAGAC